MMSIFFKDGEPKNTPPPVLVVSASTSNVEFDVVLNRLNTGEKNNFLSFVDAVGRLDPAEVKDPVSMVLKITGEDRIILKKNGDAVLFQIEEFAKEGTRALKENLAQKEEEQRDIRDQIDALVKRDSSVSAAIYDLSGKISEIEKKKIQISSQLAGIKEQL